jgi:tetratricopeptide (TPR) repeat protein
MSTRFRNGIVTQSSLFSATSIGFRKALKICVFSLLATGCSGRFAKESEPSIIKKPGVLNPEEPTTQTKGLVSALAELEGARYALAEASLHQLIANTPSARTRAEIGLAKLWLMTGKRESATSLAQPHCLPNDQYHAEACLVAAESLRQQGYLDRSIELLRPFATEPNRRRLNLLFADLLAEKGLSSEARSYYKRLLVDIRDSRMNDVDAPHLAIAARAAHRLGSFQSSNELFNEAERNGVANVETLIWRGELYLDAHDPKHARAIADEALRYAPNHPDALLLYAKVRLAESRDTQTAELYALRVLEINPLSADAYFVLAGIALRDLDYDKTSRYIELGLSKEPRHLELLSLRAATHFLADRTDSFQKDVALVLSQNPDYSRLFRLVAEYSEAENRYVDTIPLLRHATALDPNDAQVHAQLGIQLVRSGEESEGRRELLRAFAQDPFDLRVRNTLVLYERQLDHEYSTFTHRNFEVRVPNALKEPLAQIIPSWLDVAFADMTRRYGKLNDTSIRLEFYADQDSFGVRTSGVPASYLQGVCFGNTVVTRLPFDEPVNVGMTLWHELSHVFHLQLSKHRVPRWFTEGLAEFETKHHRPEWAREQELNVYKVFVTGKLPKILEMNRAFSHAANLDDLAVAYVTSTYLVEYLVERFGFAQMPKLLVSFAQGLPTENALLSVLGVSIAELDRGFIDALSTRFSRFNQQYIPPTAPPSLPEAQLEFEQTPNDPKQIAALAHAELLAGKPDAAQRTLRRAVGKNLSHPDVLWITSLVAITKSNPQVALRSLDEMQSSGYDGYYVRSQRSMVLRQLNQPTLEREALIKAHHFHPTASEPLYRLATLAKNENDLSSETTYVATLCKLEEADAHLHRRHVELRLALKQPNEAWTAAETLAYVDPLSSESHLLIAKAAKATQKQSRASLEHRLATELASSPTDRQRLNGLQVEP